MNYIPSNIQLHTKSRVLELHYTNGEAFTLPCEYLRVFSPSAEVRGHGPGQEVLQVNKETVNIIAIEPVGQYAIRLVFDDAHNSGLYDWQYLYKLGINRKKNWQDYLHKLEDNKHIRSDQEHDKWLLD